MSTDRWMTARWMAAGAVVGALAAATGPWLHQRSRTPPAAGLPADLQTLDLRLAELEVVDGEARPLDLLGAVEAPAVLIDFWATWCASCRAELPELEELKAELEGRMAVFGVLIEGYEGDRVDAQVAEKLADFEIAYPNFFASAATYESVETVLGRPISAVPTKLVLDSERRIRYVVEGPRKRAFYRRLQAGLEASEPESVP